MAEILLLAHRIPYPPTKGDKIRAYHFLTHLARTHVVHLGCFVDAPDDWQHTEHLRALCGECHFAPLPWRHIAPRVLAGLVRNEALSIAILRDGALARWIRELVERRPVEGVFAYSSAMAQYLAPARRLQRIIDFVDVDSEKWRQMAARRRWPWAWLYRRESLCLRAFDRAAVGWCDRCLFVSAAEARAFQELIPRSAAKTFVVPNGVDSQHFSPELRFPCPFEPGGPVVAFTGDMAYWPNEDALVWFAQGVLPRLRTQHPDLRLVGVGRSPSRRLRRAAERLAITLTGAVPDVRPFLAHAAVVVAPLRIARGVPNKVLEAMAMGKAVVATPAALTGLEVRPDDDILVGTDLDSLAEATARALDPAFARGLGEKARMRVIADYAWDSCLRKLDQLIACAPPASRLSRPPVAG